MLIAKGSEESNDRVELVVASGIPMPSSKNYQVAKISPEMRPHYQSLCQVLVILKIFKSQWRLCLEGFKHHNRPLSSAHIHFALAI